MSCLGKLENETTKQVCSVQTAISPKMEKLLNPPSLCCSLRFGVLRKDWEKTGSCLMDCFKAGWMGLRMYVLVHQSDTYIARRRFGDGDDRHRAAEDLHTV